MASYKIYLISPREPSGVTWLINCLLELGIRTCRQTLGDMWEPVAGGGCTLNPAEHILRKWLPILSRQQVFHFRPGIEVEWAHDWPDERHAGHRILYFVRDPRDALFSRYRREAPGLSFQEFLDFPDPDTLLDRISNWCLFSELWSGQPDVRLCRFEDYKRDARRTLLEALDFIGVNSSGEAVDAALEASTFEKAAEAERRYRAENPEDSQLINRASQVGSWQAPDQSECTRLIAGRTATLLTRFGYHAGHDGGGGYSCFPQAETLRFFRRLAFDSATRDRLRSADPDGRLAAGQQRNLVNFMRTVDDGLLQRSGLGQYEIHTLLRSMDEFAASCPGVAIAPLQWPRQHRLLRWWWRWSDFSDACGLRLPVGARRTLARVRSRFRDRLSNR